MNHGQEARRPGDKIRVSGLTFVGLHGVYDHERRDGNRFRVDVEVELSTARAGSSDALGDTVDYRDIAQAVLDIGQGPSRHLIESLAEAMATEILTRCPIQQVTLDLRKYAAGVPGDPEWVGLQIVRRAENVR